MALLQRPNVTTKKKILFKGFKAFFQVKITVHYHFCHCLKVSSSHMKKLIEGNTCFQATYFQVTDSYFSVVVNCFAISRTHSCLASFKKVKKKKKRLNT